MLKHKTVKYLTDVLDALRDCESDIERIVGIIRIIKEHNRHLWILGNGGSLAIAQHFAQDLLKAGSVRAHALNCPSVITAYANDDRFDFSFFNPLQKLSNEDDPILIFSCSGSSRNYIEFVSGFEKRRNPILSIVGTDGGFLKTKSDVSVHVKSNDYQICEAGFVIVSDIILKNLMEPENA